MILVSGRHALPVAIGLWLALVPVAYHGIVRPTAEDCADPAALAVTRFLPPPDGETVARLVPGRDGAPAAHGKLETRLSWQAGPVWTVARTDDLGESYFVPPGHFSLSSPKEEATVVEREAGGVALPIHLRVEQFGEYANIGAHLYIFDGRPIRTPFIASLRKAFDQLVHGTLPLTAIVVEGDARVTPDRDHEALLVDWLVSAWGRYQEVCRP